MYMYANNSFGILLMYYSTYSTVSNIADGEFLSFLKFLILFLNEQTHLGSYSWKTSV